MTDENTGAAPAAAGGEAKLERTLSETYDRIVARERETTEAVEPPADRPDADKPAVDRPRGPDGKFIPKEAVAQDEAAETTETPPAADAKAAAPADAAKPAAPPETAPDKVLIPKTWQNDARRAVFIKAPPEVQKVLAEREAEMEKGVAMLQQRYAGIDQLVAPIRQRLAMEGSSPEQYLGGLMAADNMLRSDGYTAIREIARMYGIDLARAAGASPAALAQSGQQFQYDAANPLQSELAALRQELQDIKAQPAKMAEVETRQQVDAFAADPANVHFPQVRALMSSLLSSGAATTLKDAYDLAVSAHPEIRKTIEAEKSAQAQAAQAEAAKKAALEAQRSASVNMATRGGVGATNAPKGNWTQTMDRVAAKLYAS